MVLHESTSLVVVSLAAALLPAAARLLKLPAAVLEIAFGIVLGKSVLGVEFSGQWLPFLAELGFLLLMFHAGLEIDLRMLKGQSRAEKWTQAGVFAATLGLALAAALATGRGAFMALVLSTTSLGVVLPTLKDLNLSRSRLGQAILMAATLADFLTLFAITFFVMALDYGASWRFLLPLPLFAAFAVLLKVLRLWAWWRPRQAEALLGPHDAQEMGVRFSLALLFLFVGASELVGLEPVLGAFLGGCVISFAFREKGHLETKLSAVGFGFLIPLFFIHVGMGFDLANVLGAEQLAFTGLLVVLAAMVKLLPSLGFTLVGMRVRDALRTGLLLSARLSLIVAAAAIGLSKGLIDVQTKDAVVLLAVITCLGAPTLFKAVTRPRDTNGEPPPEPVTRKRPEQMRPTRR